MIVHRPFVSRRVLSLGLMALLGCSACSINLGSWGSHNSGSVSVRDGVVWVDGTKLEHQRWVGLEGQMDPAGTANLHTPTGPLELTGQPGSAWALKVLVHSEVEGDGEVVFEDGRLKLTPSEGRRALINAIRGSLPSGLGLEVSTGTGSVTLEGFDGGGDLKLDSGTGQLVLKASKVGRLEIVSGTGTVRVESVSGKELEVDTGTGDAVLSDCHFPSVELESGTGEFVFEDGVLGHVEAQMGTGDLEFRGTQVASLELESGTGDVILSRGATCKQRELDLGTGDLFER